jgi:hypothetical protein
VAQGFIDWASLTEVANSYHSDMHSAYRWSAACALEVTCALVHGEQLKVLPSGSTRAMTTRGPHDVLRAAVTEYVDSTEPFSVGSARRVADVRQWASDSVADLQGIANRCLTDPDLVYGRASQFGQWLSFALGPNLEATGMRVGGLFDLNFAAPLAAVLQVSEDELRQAWTQAQDASALARSAELRDLTKAAHVLSIMLRGRYHDLTAQEYGLQVLHHPARRPALSELTGPAAVRVPYEVTNSERMMAQLLWASGFAERGHPERIRLWAENVRLVRMASRTEYIDLPQRSSDERALDTAVDAAKRAGVRTYSRLIADCADLLLAMGVGSLSAFVVNGWPDMYVTLGAYIAARKEDLGDRATRMTFENRRRLKRLAQTPGRITPHFAP